MDIARYGVEYEEATRIVAEDRSSERRWYADVAALHSFLGALLFMPAAFYMVGFYILIPLSVIWGIKAICENTRYKTLAYIGIGVSFFYAAMTCCYFCSVC